MKKKSGPYEDIRSDEDIRSEGEARTRTLVSRGGPYLAVIFAAAVLSGCASDEPGQAERPDGGAAALPATRSSEAPAPAANEESRQPIAEGEAAEPLRRQLFPGTGRFINPRRRARSKAQETNQGTTLNFVQAPVTGFLKAVLGDILKLNFAVDPSVTGTITVNTSRPIPRSALFSAVEAIVRLNGLAIVQADDIYRVVPTANAPPGAPIHVGGPSSRRARGYGVQVVPLRFVSAAEMQKILEPLAPKGAVLRVDEARNVMILAGTGSELSALMEAVATFDVDWLAGMSFGMFPIEFSEASTISEELTKIFGANGETPVAGLIRFVPIERLNAIMVIGQRPEFVRRAGEWISRLDLSGDKAGRRVFVYRVKNARAEKLAPLLTQIFTGQTQARETKTTLAPGLVPATLRSQPIAPPRSSTTRQGGARQPGQPSTGAAASTSTQSRRAPRATAPSETNRGASAIDDSKFRVIADDDQNALVIMATQEEYRHVLTVLQKLDVIPLQVLVEANIFEVTLTDDLRYGVQWFFEEGEHFVSLSEAASGAVSSIFPGFSYIFSTAQKKVALNALANITDVKALASPQVLVLDNQTAVLQVGDQVPVATRSSVAISDSTAPVVNDIQFRDTGVILRVRPRVNPGGLVTMEVEQEVSEVVATNTSEINSPTIQQRQIKSSIVVHAGESVALGGLIRERRTKNNTGIPWLKDIPILGNLFKSTSDNESRTELLIIFTPRVINNREDARNVTSELSQKMRSISRWFPNSLPKRP